MPTTVIADSPLDGLPPLRNEPVQARSAARLTALLDAAAAIVDEIGFERFTTAMVAERAGASIGTVYRYFPDRIAVLQSLAARNLERVLDRVVAEVRDRPTPTGSLRSPPGSASSSRRSARSPVSAASGSATCSTCGPAATERSYNSIVADTIMDALVQRFAIVDSPRTRSSSRSRSRSPTPSPREPSRTTRTATTPSSRPAATLCT